MNKHKKVQSTNKSNIVCLPPHRPVPRMSWIVVCPSDRFSVGCELKEVFLQILLHGKLGLISCLKIFETHLWQQSSQCSFRVQRAAGQEVLGNNQLSGKSAKAKCSWV
jgi:hypothetical protein